MPRFAVCARSKSRRRLCRKKNGGSDPARGRAGGRSILARQSSTADVSPDVWIWKQSRWRSARLCIRPAAQPSADCCSWQLRRPQRSVDCLAAVANTPITANCAPSRFSPSWARWKSRVPTICARTVIEASFRPTWNWISRIRSSHPGCAVCRRWSVRTRPFDHGREQMKLLAGLEVTTKSVERTAEAIGDDIAQREQREIAKGDPAGSACHRR